MAHWKWQQEADATQIAQHRARYGQPLPPGAGTAPGVYGPPDGDAPLMYGGAASLLGLGLGAMLWPLWVAVGFGLALGTVFWGLLWIGRRRIRQRDAAEAAQVRAIREAETKRQIAEMKAYGDRFR
ncbi:MAG: hypothetical protein AAGC57_08935 [Pseudomonadota bacterium]